MRASLLDGLPAAVAAALAVAVIAAYVWGAAGGAVWPASSAALALAAAAGFGMRTARASRSSGADGLLFLVTSAGVAAALLAASWPHLLPPGGGADVTHHLMLVEEVERTRHLVDDPAAGLRLAEMAHYTPGLHLLTVTVADLVGWEAWRLLYPIVLATVGLKAGLLALIARRVLGGVHGAASLAAAAVLLVLFVPRAYSVGGFLEAGFLAQTASAATAVAGWWALGCWVESPTRTTAALLGLAAAATFLIWPVYLGPLALAAALALWRNEGLTGRVRRAHLAWAALPTVVVSSLHLWRHADWLSMAGTSGAVPAFRPDAALVALVGLALVGLLARRDTPATRVVALVGGGIVLQALALWGFARVRGVDSPYMAAKMIYLAAYPLAVLASAGLARIAGAFPRRWHAVCSWVALAVVAASAERLVARVVIPPPLVSIDLHDAGTWLRERAAPECVDYAVANRDVAYWLHLAVMRNPRVTDRTAALDGYTANGAVGRWVDGSSLPFAVADRRLLPAGLAAGVTTLRTFGDAVVLSRPRRDGDPDCRATAQPLN